MYNENHFSIKNVILEFLFVALFIFILIWLFPLKSDLTNAINDLEVKGTDISVLTDRIFNENIISMKDAAKSYYTTPRLPKNVGDKVKMTLGEMLEKKIILPFTDKNGKACDTKASYVEITKYDEEFIMKVNLKCGKEENYLLVYMGCYDYCQTALCEKHTSDVKAPVVYKAKKEVKPTPAPAPTPAPQPTPQPQPQPTVEYLYEYKKTTDGYYKESDWSEWLTEAVSATSARSVKVKTVNTKKLIGYNVTKETDFDSPIYANKVVNIGTETILVCNKWDYVPAGKSSVSNGEWNYVGLVTLYSVPTNTSTEKYEFVRFTDETCNESCSSTTGMIFKKYTVGSASVDLSTYECVSSGYKTVQLSTTVQTITGYNTKITKKEPVYKEEEVKYYSYKTRTYVAGTTDIKWSVYNDTTLIAAGYKATGNKKQK